MPLAVFEAVGLNPNPWQVRAMIGMAEGKHPFAGVTGCGKSTLAIMTALWQAGAITTPEGGCEVLYFVRGSSRLAYCWDDLGRYAIRMGCEARLRQGTRRFVGVPVGSIELINAGDESSAARQMGKMAGLVILDDIGVDALASEAMTGMLARHRAYGGRVLTFLES